MEECVVDYCEINIERQESKIREYSQCKMPFYWQKGYCLRECQEIKGRAERGRENEELMVEDD